MMLSSKAIYLDLADMRRTGCVPAEWSVFLSLGERNKFADLSGQPSFQASMRRRSDLICNRCDEVTPFDSDDGGLGLLIFCCRLVEEMICAPGAGSAPSG